MRKAAAVPIAIILLTVIIVGVIVSLRGEHEARSAGSRLRLNNQLVDAVSAHNLALTQSLLRQGANPNAVEHGRGSDLDGLGGWPALLVAAEGPDNGLVGTLLDAGANPNAKDS